MQRLTHTGSKEVFISFCFYDGRNVNICICVIVSSSQREEGDKAGRNTDLGTLRRSFFLPKRKEG